MDEYTFEPYDVLQVEDNSGLWLDVSTLRTDLDAQTAIAAVDAGRLFDRDAQLRIVRRGVPFEVVYSRP